MIPTKFHTFVDGRTDAGKITAERLNKNWDNLYDMFDPSKVGIAEDNIAQNAKILISNRNYTGGNKITGLFEFSSFPIVPDNSIPDSKLSNNIPKKDAANTFSALQTFNAGIDLNKAQAKNIVIDKVSTLPSGTSADIGRIVYCTADNKFYGWNGTEWRQLDYIGDYTGGAIRTYTAELLVESNKEGRLYFKTEGSSPTVKLAIKAFEFPTTFYTELPYHYHGINLGSHTHEISQTAHTHDIVLGSHTHSGTFATDAHTHLISGSTQANGGHDHTASQSAHSHSISLETGTQSANHVHGMDHVHDYYYGDLGTTTTSGPSSSETTGQSADHTHTVSGDTSSAQPDISISSVSDHSHNIYFNSGTSSANGSVSSTDLGTKTSSGANASINILGTNISGNSNYAGINTGLSLSTVRKQFADRLHVIIDTTDITNNILTAKGWSSIGNNTGTHPIHTDGTGELNISSWVSLTPGLHILKITEPVSERGCSVLVHLETS